MPRPTNFFVWWWFSWSARDNTVTHFPLQRDHEHQNSDDENDQANENSEHDVGDDNVTEHPAQNQN